MNKTAITTNTHRLGRTLARYLIEPRSGAVGLMLVPQSKVRDIVERREYLETPEVLALPKRWQPMRAWNVDSLVQLKFAEDPAVGAFAQGRTMRGGKSVWQLRFQKQSIVKRPGTTTIITVLKSPRGLVCEHHLMHRRGCAALEIKTVVRNRSRQPVTVEMLSSFSLGGITPFSADDAPERLWVHRFRSSWAAEGRLESLPIERLQLERSWVGYPPAVERFGQVGSLPVRGFFPFVAVEERVAGVVWGAQLATPGSWQMELFRRDDCLNISGGLADREFGQWFKTIAPGESFTTPCAIVACVAGNLDDLCDVLTATQNPAADTQPHVEKDLPIIANEWCSSWGNPTHDNLVSLARRLKGTPTKYLVIDDGWAERPGDGIQQNGDWLVNRKSFPKGLKATCDAIRAEGIIPGIWFEFEVVNEGARAFRQMRHQLHRDGRPLQVGGRRFWDFRDPWVTEYLSRRMIRLLRAGGFGYLKVDYNETIGPGCDGAESPGEGLRQQMEAVQAFFRKLRQELPELVIENCSSGGHRLEPSMQGLCAMGSFSDAHETVEVPIIAANLQRLILPRQSSIWAVLHRKDSLQRLTYSLAATFLGRMCISGELHELTPRQWAVLLAAQNLYHRVWPIIKNGQSRCFGELGESWRHPRGWQAVRRVSADGKKILLVAHSFAGAQKGKVKLPLPPGKWSVADGLGHHHRVCCRLGGAEIELGGAFRGLVALLEKTI